MALSVGSTFFSWFLACEISSLTSRLVKDERVFNSCEVLSQAGRKYCRLDGSDTRIFAIICVSSTAAPISLSCAAICSIPAIKFIIVWSENNNSNILLYQVIESTLTVLYLVETYSCRIDPTAMVRFQLRLVHIPSESCSTFQMPLHSLGAYSVFRVSSSSI